MARCTIYNIMWLSQWLSPVSSTNKTELLLKVALNTINQPLSNVSKHWIKSKNIEHSVRLLKCEEILFIVPCFPDIKVLLPTGNPTDISET